MYWVRNADHEAPYYAVFSIPLLAPSLRPKYLSQHRTFERPQPTFLSNVKEEL